MAKEACIQSRNTIKMSNTIETGAYFVGKIDIWKDTQEVTAPGYPDGQTQMQRIVLKQYN